MKKLVCCACVMILTSFTSFEECFAKPPSTEKDEVKIKQEAKKACAYLAKLKLGDRKKSLEHLNKEEFLANIRAVIDYLHSICGAADHENFRIIEAFLIEYHQWRDTTYFKPDQSPEEAGEMLDALLPVIDHDCLKDVS